MKHIYKNTSASLAIAFFFLFNTACLQNLHALDKTAILTGTWNNAAIWLPTGVPASTDNAIISIGVTVTLTSSQSIAAVTVNTGGTLILSSGYTLTMNGALTVNGTMDMNDGNITQNTNLAPFVIGSTGVFEWEPGTNTLGAASLFTRSVESFATTSTLKIKRWYDYTNVPLGSVVTGHFGNLVMNSQTGSNIYEWNQNNKFETHEILGTLTIDQGWITLDRSGSISNTTIGNIVLLSANSSLYLLRGNHAGSFLLNTNSVTITNGTLYGLLDGTGNVTINVGGNFTTSGNFKLVYNDGVLNTGNGNGTLNISGTYSQSAGDTRLMYNISTTNSGVFTFTVGNVLFTGGIFMGQYGCHNLNQACIFSVTSNLTINFSNSSDVFRGCGLTSLSGYMNTAQLNFSVGGNFTITANSNGSEFTSAAAAGGENIVISGNMSVSGGKISFNYGFPTASHDVVFVLTGNMTVSGGVFNLSKHLGQGMYTINGNLTLSSGGLLAIKGDDGEGDLVVNGNYLQTGGTFLLHYNNSKVSSALTRLIVNGNFTHSGGTIKFDDNSSNANYTNELVIQGPNYNLTGNGIMTQAGTGTSTAFGLIRFNRAGTINFNRTASGHSISQVKQVVETGTTLDVIAGNVQLASHPTVGTDYFTVNSGATLKLRAGQVYSNGIYTNSGINVQNGGTISTMNLFGLYDGTNFAAIKAASNMNYYLAGNSTVEYNGWSNQIITGTGAGIATTDNHKYGILNINFNGTPDLNYLYPTSSNVFVRTALTLNIGELFLNGYTLTVENGSTVAIARTTGYIKSESSQANNSSYVKWKNMTSGTHEFPFGKRTSIYIPVFFSPVTGMGGDVMISTRSTLSDNQPYALMPSSLSAVSMSGLDPTENVIDRWWDFTATGFTANVTLSYPAEENTLLSTLKSGALSINKWSDQSWESYSNAGTGVTTGIGTVTIPSASVFTSWMVSTQNAAPLPVSLLDFTATPSGKDVILKWTTAIEVNNDFYTLEKSQDGTTFSSLAKVKGNGNSNSILNYRHADTNPKEGITFYRLKQTDFDGTTVNLKTVSINLGNIYSSHNLSIESVFPNPFSSSFTLLFNSSTKQNTEVKVTDMNGKMIHAESLMCEEGRNSFKYSNFEEIPKGIYFINLTAGGKALTQKIVKN